MSVGDAHPRRSADESVGDLLVRAADGDQDAFAGVYAQMSGPVYGAIRRVLRDAAQSEEVAQEAFLQVWQEAGRFDARAGTAHAWIMTIAHRRAVDRVRSEVSLSARHGRLAARAFEAPFDTVSEQVLAHVDVESVRGCLGNLGALHRESILLAYYGGWTYREVAEHLGVPLATVKTRIRDGLIRLRDCVGGTAAGVHQSGTGPAPNTGQ